jgi:hypothetical protein
LSLVEHNNIGLLSGSAMPESATTPCNNQNKKYDHNQMMFNIKSKTLTYAEML